MGVHVHALSNTVKGACVCVYAHVCVHVSQIKWQERM